MLCYNRVIMKNILVLLWSNRTSMRNFLYGFALHARTRRDWIVHLRSPEDLAYSAVAEKVKVGFYSGIVADEETLKAHPEIAMRPETALVLYATYNPGFRKPGGNVVFAQHSNAVAGEFGANYLMRLGRFRSFGYVPITPPTAWSKVRGEGFAAQIAKRGGECRILCEDEPLGAFLESLPKPAAVMGACDRVALDVLEACREAHIDVPRDMSVLGVDNDEIICEFARPSLTSIIRSSPSELGRSAAKALSSLMRKGGTAKPRVVEYNATEVVERESCAFLPPATHIANTVMEFIRKNAGRHLKVNDVVAHVGVSRRLVEKRFSEIFGKSIIAAITECRLDEVAKKLTISNLPVGKVAALCGFHDVTYLGKLFRSRFGTTMTEWRLRTPYPP